MKALLIEYDELAPVLDTYDVALKFDTVFDDKYRFIFAAVRVIAK
jgi:hypothetical protein